MLKRKGPGNAFESQLDLKTPVHRECRVERDENIDTTQNGRALVGQQSKDSSMTPCRRNGVCSEVGLETPSESESLPVRGCSTRRGDTYQSDAGRSPAAIDPTPSRLDAKLRARLKRQFVRTQWVDINKAPSWPPIKKNKYLDSDWKAVKLNEGEIKETKKHRLFLNTLCYLCEGIITKRSTLGRQAGLGLFCQSLNGFDKGFVITEFVGWLVDREQAEAMRRKRRASHIVAVQKGFLYIDGVKDPFYGTGGGSFANDGSEFLGGPGNNAVFYHWFDDELGRMRVFLRATRRIDCGDEIFVPYDKQYWQDNFEEQEENCPDAYRRKRIAQLQRKYNDMTITSMHDIKERAAALASAKAAAEKSRDAKITNLPKRYPVKVPTSAYIRYYLKRRKEIVAKNPDMRLPKYLPQLTRQVGEEWRNLDCSLKNRMQEEAAADFEAYHREVSKWKETQRGKRRKKRQQ